MKRGPDRVLLLQPPYGDYSYPYHSLSYVAAALEAAGCEVKVLDINALWFRSVFTPQVLASWRAEFTAELAGLEAAGRLDAAGQQRLVTLLRGIALCDAINPQAAIGCLQSESFYDWEIYRDARRQVRLFEALLDIVHAPYDFSTAFSIPPHEGNACRLVERAAACDRWRGELADLLSHHARDDYLFCGASAPFSANLAPALVLLQAVGTVFPGLPRLLGGTAATDLYKYRLGDESLVSLAGTCDALYLGEAEPGAAGLLAWARGEAEPPPQVFRLDRAGQSQSTDPVYVALSKTDRGDFQPFDWAAHPARYDWIDWSLYLSPARRVNYAPVRGCFWNRCTFCDYGLNGDAPTAPSRAMDPALAARDLAALSRAGVGHVYLAADALSPRFLRQLAERLLADGTRISWACQLFITPGFDFELVDLLARSGLKIASFGLESGSAPVLERMGKGRDRVRRVLEPAYDAFRASFIGLQPLFFFGFPGETDSDRQATVDMLLGNQDIFSTLSKGGQFELLSGSAIARRPSDFGLSGLARPDDDDIGGALDYRTLDERPGPRCDAARPFNAQIPHRPYFERPWVGGIDTFHTHLYAERFGRDVFHRLPEPAEADPAMIGISSWSAFDLEAAMENVLILEALDRTGQDGAESALEADVLAAVSLLEPEPAPALYSLQIRPYQEL